MLEPITLSFPAHASNVALARSAAATLAARLDFTIDQVEDARLAIDEAVSHLITGGDETITCSFIISGTELTMVVTSNALNAPLPDPEGFGWIVMRALVDEVRAEELAGLVTLTLLMRGLQPAGA
jgi:serine/threonine-protein kinase RsbW